MSQSKDALSGVHRTALSAAALRAAHTLAGAEPKIFRDDLALPLSGMTADEVLTLAARVPSASAATCVVRSRFTEDRLDAARARLDQYVLLGAGLDSYALRAGEALSGLTVFEVDDPPFQAWKRQRIAQLGLTPPAGLRFVPCDFERTSLAEALGGHGFARDRPCFVSWLGVTQYLTREAIGATLCWAGAQAPGSEIVLTFLESNAQAMSLTAAMAQTGVAVRSHFTLQEMSGLLRAAGFSQVEHLTPAEADARYFRDRADGLSAPQIQRLVAARV